MPSYRTEDIRNIVLASQAGAGKTTLLEALLHQAGVIGAMGSIEKGDTVSDFADEEKQHGHSLFNTIVHCEHDGAHINLIDTPGMADFFGQTVTALPAIETVAVVIDAAAGIEATTRRVMEQAKRRNHCRMIVINKCDSQNADLPGLLERLRETFGSECLPINLPADHGRAVVDCFFNPAGESDFGSVAEAHTALIDQVVEVDEKLMALYLEQGEELDADQLHEPFEKALREGHLVPVCFVAG
ncbi:MAG: GTP-binding protein, partial [Phycisphaeraceae bacterium]